MVRQMGQVNSALSLAPCSLPQLELVLGQAVLEVGSHVLVWDHSEADGTSEFRLCLWIPILL